VGSSAPKPRAISDRIYDVEEPAFLEGQLFNFTGASHRYGLGAFYGLQVGARKANPRRAFADMNPNFTYEHSSSEHH
jgi:hypothetical protein